MGTLYHIQCINRRGYEQIDGTVSTDGHKAFYQVNKGGRKSDIYP